jgi:hypothetical protein
MGTQSGGHSPLERRRFIFMICTRLDLIPCEGYFELRAGDGAFMEELPVPHIGRTADSTIGRNAVRNDPGCDGRVPGRVVLL